MSSLVVSSGSPVTHRKTFSCVAVVVQIVRVVLVATAVAMVLVGCVVVLLLAPRARERLVGGLRTLAGRYRLERL